MTQAIIQSECLTLFFTIESLANLTLLDQACDHVFKVEVLRDDIKAKNSKEHSDQIQLLHKLETLQTRLYLRLVLTSIMLGPLFSFVTI